MQITAEMVKNLREATGAGMMDCRKALMDAEGNMAEAEKILKKMGLAAVAKRAERATESGRVDIAAGKSAVALVSVACETDFVAKNETFKKAVGEMAKYALDKKLNEVDDKLKGMVNDLISTIKENMGVKKVVCMPIDKNEAADYYIHNDGALGAIVKFRCDKPECFSSEKVKAFMHDTALHVMAFNPQYLNEAAVEAKFKSEQMEIFKAQVASLDKPDKVKDGIVMGKYSALLKEICLMNQGFFRDEKISTEQALKQISKEVGCALEIVDYICVRAGV
ncbi:MAG TPA: translation elongation factor Ts [Spirochaetaceae bacterium]|nr:translation elongation factor Ts [Spirochaetaceae bacterium]